MAPTSTSPAKKPPAKPKKASSPQVNKYKQRGFTVKKNQLSNMGKSQAVIICVAAPAPFQLEFYIIAKDESDRSDFYNRCIDEYMRQVVSGSIQPDVRRIDFEEANFTRMFTCRAENTDNRALTNEGQPYWRRLLGRDVSNEDGSGESTPATRQQGFEVLRGLMMDQNWVRYPPANGFQFIDMTGPGSILDPMCKSLMDNDIEELMTNQWQTTDLVNTFYTRFPDLATSIWDPNTYRMPEFARSLGYP